MKLKGSSRGAFFKNKIADFEIIEFMPTMTCVDLDKFKNQKYSGFLRFYQS